MQIEGEEPTRDLQSHSLQNLTAQVHQSRPRAAPEPKQHMCVKLQVP